MRSGRVDSLQVLRFLAAFLVLCAHTQHSLVERMGEAAGIYAFIPFDWGLGVDIFFLISGFVMYYMMHDRFGQPGMASDFLRRRIVRVVPLYWLFTTLLILSGLVLHAPLPSVARIAFSYLFLPGPTCDAYCMPVFTLGWTLNYEMLFYAIFALGLLLPRPRGMALVVATMPLLIAVAWLLPADWQMLRFWGSPLILEFLFGVGIAHLFLRGRRLSAPVAWAMVAAGFALAVWLYQIRAFETIERVVTGGIPAALIVGGAVLGLEPRRETRWIALLVAGGNASYALYLSHPFVIRAFEMIAGRVPAIATRPMLFLIVTVIAAVIVAPFVHHLIEKPLLRLLNRRWSRYGSTGLGDGQPAPGRSGLVSTPDPGSR